MAGFTIEQYVDQKNKWAELLGGKKLSLLNRADRQKIADSLDSDLSPENLSCDGELRGLALKRRYAYLTKAAVELKSIDPTVEIYGF